MHRNGLPTENETNEGEQNVRAKILIPAVLLVITSFLIFFWYFGFVGLLLGAMETLLLFVLANPFQSMGFLASAAKSLRSVNFYFEKAAVAKRLESCIGLYSKKINEGKDFLPHGVNINWVEAGGREAFLKEGKVVVCLESSQNEDRNLSRATLLYVAEDLIRESQRFVDPVLMKSLSFAVTRTMLMQGKRFGALKCLNDEFIETEAEKNPSIRNYVLTFDKIEREGHLNRIVLEEFSELNSKLSPAITDPKAFQETRDFVEFIRIFEEKGKTDVPLRFNEKTIKIHLLPVARLNAYFDPDSFVKRTSESHRDGIEKIYVLARGNNYVLAQLVVEEIEKAKLYKKISETRFKVHADNGLIESYLALLARVN